jgi:hypothetical protein
MSASYARVGFQRRFMRSMYSNQRVIVFFVISALILPAIFLYPFNVDTDVWQWIGSVFVHYGELPYIGAWDNAFPGVTVAHAVAIYFFGNSMIAFRFVEYLAILITTLVLYRTSRLWLSDTESLLGCTIFSLFYAYGRWDCMGQRDSFAVLPIVSSIFFFAKASRQRDSRLGTWFMIAGGCMIGIATVIRPTYALLLVVPVITLYGLTNFRAIGFVLVGFLVPIVLAIVPYALTPGGIQKAYYAAIRYNADVYSHIPPSAARFRWYLYNLLELRTLMVFVLGTGWIIVYVFSRVRGLPCVVASPHERSFLVLFLGVMLFGMFSQQALAAVHFTPFYACFIPVLTKTLSDITRPLGRWRPKFIAAVMVAIASVLYPWRLAASFVEGPFSIESAYRCFPETFRLIHEDSFIASYLTHHTNSDEFIEVIGDPGVLWRTPRRKTNRFQGELQLLLPSYTGKLTDYQRQWRTELFQSFTSKTPRFIVISRDVGATENTLFYNSMSHTPEIKDFIQRNYVLDTLLDLHVIYVRR